MRSAVPPVPPSCLARRAEPPPPFKRPHPCAARAGSSSFTPGAPTLSCQPSRRAPVPAKRCCASCLGSAAAPAAPLLPLWPKKGWQWGPGLMVPTLGPSVAPACCRGRRWRQRRARCGASWRRRCWQRCPMPCAGCTSTPSRCGVTGACVHVARLLPLSCLLPLLATSLPSVCMSQELAGS